MKVIETDRLILRTWKDKDCAEYFRINQDPKVLEHLPGPLTMDEANDFIMRMRKQWDEKNYTIWAAEEKYAGKFIGFIGLSYLNWGEPFEPCVEIGWRLGSEHWGKGYATEGAKAALEYGFDVCRLEEIVAITVPANTRSQRVMDKIGLIRDMEADFAHPKLPADHRLSQHIFYRKLKG